jgi:hypothetical protein
MSNNQFHKEWKQRMEQLTWVAYADDLLDGKICCLDYVKG